MLSFILADSAHFYKFEWWNSLNSSFFHRVLKVLLARGGTVDFRSFLFLWLTLTDTSPFSLTPVYTSVVVLHIRIMADLLLQFDKWSVVLFTIWCVTLTHFFSNQIRVCPGHRVTLGLKGRWVKRYVSVSGDRAPSVGCCFSLFRQHGLAGACLSGNLTGVKWPHKSLEYISMIHQQWTVWNPGSSVVSSSAHLFVVCYTRLSCHEPTLPTKCSLLNYFGRMFLLIVWLSPYITWMAD